MITTTYSLVEICKIRSGKRLPKGCDFSEEPTAYKYIRARDIKNGTIDGSDLVHISEEVQSKIKKYIVNTNDIVITIVGASVGDVAYVASEFDGMNLTENAVRLTEFAPHVNPKYLMYILNSSEYWELMQQIAGGAAQPKLGIYKIEAIKVHLPAKEVQDRIVDILCTYDDLIENNQKQIKLLEEAAQRLYKEWFVDLRFPGHETTPITDGIPEGWVRYKFSEIASIMSGGTPKTDVKEYYDGNIPFYTPKDCDGSFFAFDTITHISKSGLDHCNSQYYPSGTVIITARGTVGKTTILAVPMAMNQSCYALKCDELNSPYYLFFSLNKEVAALKTMANGGVFNTIIVKTFDSIHLTVPTHDVLIAFDAIVSPIMDQIKVKMQQNVLLVETRDRLLPKLMNGEIEV